mmetsp:Transcript_27193/g.41734  ORF Transcript_27193/g.41734 Transcript_27193/m.41734 type:complete len:191 (-) Transcript_27193:233-805(-)
MHISSNSNNKRMGKCGGFWLTKVIILLLAATTIVLASTTPPAKDDCGDDGSGGDCSNPDALRLITEEELSQYDGIAPKGTIWISVLGEVFDVTGGREYYGEGNSYHVFAGRDASPCFVTGDFTVEGGKKSLDELDVRKLKEIERWRDFYKTHEVYKPVGFLHGKYYDENGKPTYDLDLFNQRLATFRKKK